MVQYGLMLLYAFNAKLVFTQVVKMILAELTIVTLLIVLNANSVVLVTKAAFNVHQENTQHIIEINAKNVIYTFLDVLNVLYYCIHNVLNAKQENIEKTELA